MNERSINTHLLKIVPFHTLGQSFIKVTQHVPSLASCGQEQVARHLPKRHLGILLNIQSTLWGQLEFSFQTNQIRRHLPKINLPDGDGSFINAGLYLSLLENGPDACKP